MDKLVRIPSIFKHLFISGFGISGVFYIYHGGVEINMSKVLFMILVAFLSGLSTYGFVSLLADIKRGKTMKGFIEEVKQKINDAIGY